MDKYNSNLPVKCPSCSSGLSVKSLYCPECETTVNGKYQLPNLLLLEKEEQEFIYTFVKKSGSLKEMANEMQLSYPSVRNYLNNLIKKLEQIEDETTRSETN